MEIEVFVDADQLADTEEGKYRAVTAFFTYISLDKENKPLPVPPLKVGHETSFITQWEVVCSITEFFFSHLIKRLV